LAVDYYSVLGVNRDATDKEIKSAYRQLARKLHPDLNQGDTAASERFKQVNEAHEILGDPKKRKDYDEFGESWKHADELRKHGAANGYGFPPGGGRGQGGSSSHDFFGDGGGSGIFDLFNFGGRGRQARSNVEGSIEITLDEAFHGASRRISIDGPSGARTLEVLIPAGIQSNGKIRLAPDPQTGVTLTVKVLPHKVFTRAGDDLQVNVRVSYLDAALGGEVEVSTLTGRIALTVPPGTQNNRSFRIPGKGMPKRDSGKFGDLIATVDVRMPDKITDEQRRLFEQLRELERRPASHGEGR
jgi:curved DNA-binding protein